MIRRLALIALGLLVGVGVLEAGARAYYRVAAGARWTGALSPLPLHPVFGWEGRRIFGDRASSRPRLFVLGDSFTAGLGVPDRELYASRLGELLDVEVFMYAGPGYGTLQEYLALDHYLPEVRPDLVLVQLCRNDAVNNLWALERSSYLNNNLMVRPYLEGDRIVYRFPLRVNLGPLINHSRLGHLIVMKSARLLAMLADRRWLQSSEYDIRDRRLAMPEFRASVETTRRILARMRARAAPARLIVFPADGAEREWRELVTDPVGLPFVEAVSGAIRRAEANGAKVRMPDGAHWNAAGHQIVAETLAPLIAGHLR